VNYSSQRTELSSEQFGSDPRLLKADALWCENKQCSVSNPRPMDPKASVLATTPQRHAAWLIELPIQFLPIAIVI